MKSTTKHSAQVIGIAISTKGAYLSLGFMFRGGGWGEKEMGVKEREKAALVAVQGLDFQMAECHHPHPGLLTFLLGASSS